MPAGNDAAAAARELDQQYGGHSNAEDMILAHDRSFDRELRAALEKPVDADATASLGNVKAKYGGAVLSAAVRGGRLVVVEMVDGRPVKWHEEYKGSGRGAAKASGAPSADLAQAERQAAAGVGGTSDDDGQAAPGTGTDGQGADAGSGVPDTSGATGEDEHAPSNVTADQMRDALNDARISVPADKRNKDGLWSLLPEGARAALLAAAPAPQS